MNQYLAAGLAALSAFGLTAKGATRTEIHYSPPGECVAISGSEHLASSLYAGTEFAVPVMSWPEIDSSTESDGDACSSSGITGERCSVIDQDNKACSAVHGGGSFCSSDGDFGEHFCSAKNATGTDSTCSSDAANGGTAEPLCSAKGDDSNSETALCSAWGASTECSASGSTGGICSASGPNSHCSSTDPANNTCSSHNGAGSGKCTLEHNGGTCSTIIIGTPPGGSSCN